MKKLKKLYFCYGEHGLSMPVSLTDLKRRYPTEVSNKVVLLIIHIKWSLHYKREGEGKFQIKTEKEIQYYG